MNKNKFINIVTTKAGLSKKDAKSAINTVIISSNDISIKKELQKFCYINQLFIS